ncbi:unnamed protein product [Ceutorhynchus assimilis]|uniref:Retrotransposon gag domain-containing protein n=1 Tax=Ceutorhynchus assimilis TaxID=467358 RepID=A0A9N9MPJ1_9CUCU|nr:unnamed protein product [Ceutorhynchus assimilis]
MVGQSMNFMQTKLQGAARAWLTRLDDYNLSWQAWKVSLSKAFPSEHDYAELLTEMLARVKVTGETMTHYYHDKITLIGRYRSVIVFD